MEKFLDYAVKEILNDYPSKNLHLLTIIVPSERSKWNLKKSLSTALKKSVIYPEIKTIQNYFNSTIDLNTISNLEAKLIMYEQALKLDNQIEYKDFQNRSDILLKNFNDVERNMIEHHKLFQELDNISGIENWSLNDEYLSENQYKYIKLFKKTGELYKNFKNQLIKENKGVNGLITRRIAETPTKYIKSEKVIYFIGLNALSKSEETIVNYLTKNNSSKVIVDTDEFYTSNIDHEAGYFYRKHQNKFYNKSFKKIKENKKEINIYSSITANQQIDIIDNIIKRSNKKYTIILMDETLGPLVYQKLYKSEKNINFSSGLKFKYFESNQLIKFLLDSETIFKTKKVNYQWIENLVNFSCIESVVSREKIQGLFINRNQKSYEINILKAKKIHSIIDQIMTSLENFFDSTRSNISKNLLDLLNILEKIYLENDKEVSIINKIKIQVQKINGLIEHYKTNINHREFIKIFMTEINRLSVVVKGENDSRIQIIGLLESRIIDYENIIFSSCNEEYLPAKPNTEDLFPEDLKKLFGIPSIYEREALSAYYFYRNFHYAKNINILYVKGDNKGLNYNEPSRYIRQIEKEMGDLNNITINYHHVKMDIVQNKHFVKNNQEIKQLINCWMKNGISPSSIQKYCNCELDFYFKYILKIKEKKKLHQYLEPSEWGIAVHKTLEKLFFKERKIDIEEIIKIKKDFPEIMLQIFSDVFTDKRFINGKNALVYHHYKKCLESLLEKEILDVKEFGSYKILEVEKELDFKSSIKNVGLIKNIKLLGHIDRVDLTDQGIRLIDYKTGMVQQNELNIYDFNQLSKKQKSLQLLFYALLWRKNYKSNEYLQCQIISLKNTFQPKLNLTYKKKTFIENDVINNFQIWLEEFLKEINNTEIFKHDLNSKYCEIC